MIFNAKIENIYLLCGLALSGQNVFINWFLSLINENDTVYFFNNINNISEFNINDNLNHYEVLKNKIINKGKYITNQNNYDKLAKELQYFYFLEGKIKNIKYLVIFIDDNPVSVLDILGKKFKNYNNLYKIICIRDIFNLFSERIHYNTINNGTYDYNMKTYGLYTNNLFSTKNNNYITFNLNKFLLESTFRKNLAFQLNLNYNTTRTSSINFITNSNFKNIDSDKDDLHKIQKYFMVWYYYKDNQFINYMIYNKSILYFMCSFFNFCFEDNYKILKIKNHYINLNNYKKLLENK